MTPAEIGITFNDSLYVGASAGAVAERFPHPARLHAALLATAATGSLSVAETSGKRPTGRSASARALETLRWLEHHPPEAIGLPVFYDPPRNRSHKVFAERGAAKDCRTHPTAIMSNNGQALHGELVYHWSDVPDEHIAVLNVLAAEMAYLGTSRSTVSAVLRTGAQCALPAPEHDRVIVLEPGTAPSRKHSLALRTATAGRTDVLCEAYRLEQQALLDQLNSKKGHSAPSKNPQPDEHDTRAPGTPIARMRASHLARRNYRRVAARLRAPWGRVFVVPLDSPVAGHQAVEAAVRTHRTLVAIIGTDCPSAISGVYADDEPKAANHTMIQPLPAPLAPTHLRQRHPDAPTLLLVAAPADIGPEDLALLESAVGVLSRAGRKLAGGRNRVVDDLPPISPTGGYSTVEAETFWADDPAAERDEDAPAPMASANARIVYPVAINEITADVDSIVQIGLAGVFRQRLISETGGAPLGLRQTLTEWRRLCASNDIAVGHSELVIEDLGAYLHKLPRNDRLHLAPYRARIELDELVGPDALVAIGQTRHLGGGLLVPAERLPAHDDTKAA